MFIEKPVSEPTTDTVLLHEPIPTEVFTELGATLIADYATRVLVKIPDGQFGAFTENVRALGYATYERPEFDRIRLNGYDFASIGGRPNLPADLKIEDYEGEVGLYLVQMVGPPKPEWLSELREWADIVRYFSENTFLVRTRPGTMGDLLNHPEIQYVGVHQPAFKLHRALQNAEGSVKTIIQIDRGQELAFLEQEMSRLLGRQFRVPEGSSESFMATLSIEAITVLVARPEVLWIEPYVAPAPSDERHAMVMDSQITGPRPNPPTQGLLHSAWLASKGFCVDGTSQPAGGCIDYSTKVANFDMGLDLNSCLTTNYDTQMGTCTDWNQTRHVDFDNRQTNFFCIPKTGQSFCSDYSYGKLRYYNGYQSVNFNDDYLAAKYHGTATSSLIAGRGSWISGQDGLGYFLGTGMAPRANLVTAQVFLPPALTTWGSADYQCLMSMVSGVGATFANNSWNQKKLSWGASTDITSYSSFSRLMDQLVRDSDGFLIEPDDYQHPMTIVFSAGNLLDLQGNPLSLVQAPGNAKNVISVGASEGWLSAGEDQECCTQYSNSAYPPHACVEDEVEVDDVGNIFGQSLRSTEDGRIKPDLVAPGTRLRVATSTHSGSTTDHQCFGGTSGAAPLVTGSAVLVDAWLQDILYPWKPSPAMLKAMLVAHAEDLYGGKDWLPKVAGYQQNYEPLAHSPSPPQGWGRVNLHTLIPDGGGAASGRLFYEEDHVGSTAERRFSGGLTTWSDNLEVIDPNQDLVIVMAYTDAAGSLGAAAAGVNNLNLQVVDGSGLSSFRYYGNQFLSGSKYSQRYLTFFSRVPDHLNNVEVIRVPAGEIDEDDFTVVVYAATLGGFGVPGLDGSAFNQDFALYIINAQQAGGGQ